MFSQSCFCTREALLVNRIAEHKNRLTRIAIAVVRNKQQAEQSTQEALAFLVQLFALISQCNRRKRTLIRIKTATIERAHGSVG